MRRDPLRALLGTIPILASCGAGGAGTTSISLPQPALGTTTRDTEAIRLEDLPTAPPPGAVAGESCGLDEPFGELYSTTLEYDPGLVPHTIYTVVAPVTYMCGTGPGHYSVEVPVVRDELPATHPDFHVPAWLGALLRESRVQGISNPIPAARIDALRQVFRTPSP